MEPTIDTEAPTDTPAEEPGEITVDGAELNADEAVTNQTVTITDWAKENDALKDKVDVKATVDGTEATIAEDGKITVEKDKTLVLNIVPKAGYKMSTGTAGDVTGPANVKKSGSNYSFAVSGDINVAIAVEAVKYTLSVDAAAAAGLKVKLDDSMKAELIPAVTGEAAVEIGDGESKDVKGGSTAKELKFTVKRTEAQENAGKLHVYMVVDGTDVGNRDDELAAGTKSTDATTKDVTYPYSIPAADIAEIDEKITIVLVDEAKTGVSLADDIDAKADVKFKTSKADATAENQWLAVDSADAIKSVYAGETFEFKVAVKEDSASTYAIDKVEVKNGDKEINVSQKEDVYSFVMPEGVDPDTGIKIHVTTVVSAASGHSLTFSMAEGSDEGSATAKIVEIVTSVAPAAEGGTATDKTYTSGGSAAATTGNLDSYPGLSALALEEGKAMRIPQPAKNETVKSIKVEVSSADEDVWKLVKVDPTETGQPAATVCNYTFKASPDASKNEIALEEAMALSVATEVVKAEDDRAFTLDVEKEADGTTVKAKHLTFAVPAQTGVTAPTQTDAFYKVSKDVASVNFTVTAEAGYTLADLKTGNAWFRSMSKTTAADGKTTYNVSIFTSKLAKTSETATAIVLKEEQSKFTVKINPDKGGTEQISGFTTSTRTYTGAEGDETVYPSPVTGTTEMLYGGEYKVTIEPNRGNRLKKVSYTIDEKEGPAVTLEPNDEDVDVANITINPLNGNVVITVETEKDYEIAPLRKASDDSEVTPVRGTYEVEYDQAYLVGLMQGGSAIDVTKNIRAEVKDENGAKVTVPRVVVTSSGTKMLRINLAGKTALRGQEITVDMLVDGTVVATYYLRVKKATTAITINNGEAIKQNVSSTRYYPVTFDGEGVTASTDNSTNTLKNVSVDIVNGRLEVTVPDMAFDDAVVSETKDGKKEIKSYKEAVVTVSATDNDVEQTVKVTAEPLFNPTDQPVVSEVADGTSDTTLWVTVGGMNSKVPEEGTAYYEVSATAQDKVGDVSFAGSEAEKVLEKSITPVQVPLTKDNGTYRVKLDVGKAGTKLGAGAVWTYDVQAKLVYANVEDSLDSQKAPISTADTYFASALKLAKDKSCYKGNIYTGMSSSEGFRLVKPNFTDKKVTYKIVEEDIDDDKKDSYGENQLTLKMDDEGYIVVTNVPGNATVGKHTITVTATADQTTNHTMYATRATVTVNVVKGINNLWFSGNYNKSYTNNLYQQSGKKATLKLTSALVYNSTDKKYQPKTKKVNWSVVGPDYDGSSNTDSKAPAGIEIKNGTVTVTTGFSVDSRRGHEKDNQFRVLAEAADFEGNPTYALSSVFTVTNTPLDVKNLAVAKVENGKYKVLAVQNGKTANPVSAKDLDGAFVYVLTEPATAGATYTAAQWNRLKEIDHSNFTFASNNKKLLAVDYDGELTTYGAGKKVNIKVTANDGKKANNTLILDIGWTDTAGKDLALQATAMGDDGEWISPAVYAPKKVEEDAQANYSVAGTPVLRIDVVQGTKDDGTSTSFDIAESFTNYKLSVKGAKKVTVEEDGDTYSYYVANAEKTVITLTDPNVPKGTKAKTRKLTLTNTAYAKSLDKATVKFTKGSTLHQSGIAKEQELAMTVTKGKESFGANMVAKVEIDQTALTAKNCDGYWEIESLINSRKAGAENYFDLNKDDGSTKLTFGSDDEEYTELTAGSYKLKVTVGQLNGSKFTPKSQPASATLKVAKNKVFTFKPVTSYTLNGVDGAAVLTGKSNVNAKAGEKVKVRYDELQNANVDGKSNQFTHYFKVEQDPKSGTWYLKLNTADDAVVRMMYEVETDAQGNEMRNPDGSLKVKAGSYHIPDLTKIDKKDLTGYLTYTTWPSVQYYDYNGKEDGTVKITVKAAANPKADAKSVKPSQKYVPGNAELGLVAGNEMPVNVTVNNTYVAMSYAMIDTNKKGNSEELILGGTNGVDTTTGQIVVKVAQNKKLEDGKKYTANLLVVPENSLYKELIDNPPAATPAAQAEGTTPADKKAELIQKYGIAIKITVVAKTKPTPTEAPEAVTKPGPGPSEDKEIEASVLEAVGKLNVPIANTTDVTVTTTDDGTTATLVQTGIGKIKTAVEGAASGFTAAVAATLKDVSVTEGAGTAKAEVTLSKDGYKETKVDVSVTISKGGEVTTPVVTTVKIYKKDGTEAITTDSVELDGTNAGKAEYIAKVLDADGNEMNDEEVTWNVAAETGSEVTSGTEFAGTDGTLTIAKDQKAGTLKVTATSKTNASVKSELTLTITVKSSGGGGV